MCHLFRPHYFTMLWQSLKQQQQLLHTLKAEYGITDNAPEPQRAPKAAPSAAAPAPASSRPPLASSSSSGRGGSSSVSAGPQSPVARPGRVSRALASAPPLPPSPAQPVPMGRCVCALSYVGCVPRDLVSLSTCSYPARPCQVCPCSADGRRPLLGRHLCQRRRYKHNFLQHTPHANPALQ